MTIKEEMVAVKCKLRACLASSKYLDPIVSDHLRDATLSYLDAGGKYLRPCLLLWACRAWGGDEARALPAALAVEVFHTWTLVHDDIIDRDPLRRGRPTVHEEFLRRGQSELSLGDFADHYGQSVAILTGDVQHGWAVCLLAEAALNKADDPDAALLALRLIRELEGEVLPRLIEGELLDVQLSHRSLAEVTEEDILRMISGKTAALFSFAAKAGGMIAKGSHASDCPQVKALGAFGYHAGMAFQLQDDILGVTGQEAELGKAVGADIREAKRTIPLLFAWQQASSDDRCQLERLIGRQDASEQDIIEACGLLTSLGGIAHARELAQRHLRQAMEALEVIPLSSGKELLKQLALLMVERTR